MRYILRSLMVLFGLGFLAGSARSRGRRGACGPGHPWQGHGGPPWGRMLHLSDEDRGRVATRTADALDELSRAVRRHAAHGTDGPQPDPAAP